MTQTTERQRPTILWLALPVSGVALLALTAIVIDLILRPTPGAAASGELLPEPLNWVSVVLVLAQAAMLWFRERFAVATLIAVTAIDIGLVVATLGELSTGIVAVMVAAYSVRRYRPGPFGYVLLAALASASVTVTALGLAAGEFVPDSWVLIAAVARVALTFVLPILGAELVTARARAVDALRERAELAEREQQRNAREAVAEERALMARELHDIAAHHLTGIIVSTQAADSLLGSDPERSREYVRTAGREAKKALDNLRQTVGLLRTDSAADLAPAPSLADIPALVAELREGGMAVDLQQSGEAVGLGPIAESAAYRMVQESLTNARRHAAGAASSVVIEYGEGATITVSNLRGQSTPGAGGGLGLLGMRERAALIGGTLEAGPTDDGGWRVHLTIPPLETPTEEAP